MSPPRRRLVAVAILTAAALVRVSVNDVSKFSRADETHYLLLAQRFALGPLIEYPHAARAFIADRAHWAYPGLHRFGYYLTAAAACRVSAACDWRTLTWLSTLGGIAAVLLTWLVGRRLVGEEAALLGMALVAFSPLQLALGRRALTDELVCAAVLAALWAVLRLLDAPREEPRGALALVAVLLVALALSFKETFGLYAPGLLALWLWRWRRRGGFLRTDLWLLLAPVLCYLGYCALTGTLAQYFEMLRISLLALDTDYPRQFQSGPLHRYLIDLLALSPLPVLLAIGAAGALAVLRDEDTEKPAQLAALIGLSLLSFALVSMSLRFVPAVDSLICLLAAWYLLRVTRGLKLRNAVLAVSLCAVVASDWWIFRRVFLQREVYDPTTDEVFKALDAIPPARGLSE